jgi:hypothetical protein
MGTNLVYKVDHSLNVARLANLPEEVIALAGEKSLTMEEEMKTREIQRWHLTTSIIADVQE